MRTTKSILPWIVGSTAAVALSAVSASADVLEITGLPVSSDGGFLRSIFHDAAAMGGAQGSPQAWMALDREFVSSIPCTSPLSGKPFWDTGTGAIEFGVKLYNSQENAQLNNGNGLIGYAKGVGSGLLPGNFTGTGVGPVPGIGGSGKIAGSIKWTVTGAADSLLGFLGSKYSDLDPGAGSRFVFRTSFLDKYYMGANDGLSAPPNSRSLHELSLWGSDGTPDPSLIALQGNGGFVGSKTGVDLTLSFDPLVVVPEASTITAGIALLVFATLRFNRIPMMRRSD